MPQRRRGIDAGDPQRGHEAGDERDKQEQHDNDDEGRRIRGKDAREAPQQRHHTQCAGNATREARGGPR